ncbi:tetratricopeptide repeat protein [Leptothoe sp. LEGE 181152]|nr:tetratricopeptide repeat protein [Leptothoe sp. LEGE 181152]
MRYRHHLKTVFICAILLSSTHLGNSTPVWAQPTTPTLEAKSSQQGFSLLEQGLVDQAIREFRRTLKRTPQSLEANLGLAMSYERAGRDADAFRTYQKIVDISPNNVDALRAIGKLGGYRPEWQSQGIEALSTLLQNSPQDQSALTQRALLYTYQGRFSEATEDYARVLRGSPSPETVLSAAEAYTYSGNYNQGLELFRHYQNSGRSIQGSATIAYSLAEREIGNPGRSIEILESALRQSRGENNITLQQRGALAASYAANGQFEQAETAIAPVIGRQDSRLTLARAYNELWRYSQNPAYANEAAAHYQEILAQPSQYVTIGVAREVAYALSGLPGQQSLALQVYRQLTSQQPDDIGLKFQRGVLEKQLGFASIADLQNILRGLQSSSVDMGTQRNIARGLIRLDPPEASLLPLYQALIESGLQEPLLYYRIAQVYLENQNYQAARAALATYADSALGINRQSSGLLLLADIERREGDFAASSNIYDAILRSRPTDQSITAAALTGYAEILRVQERNEEALVLYDQLLAQSPQPTTSQILRRTRLALLAKRISEAEAKELLMRSFQGNFAVERSDFFAQGDLAVDLEQFELAEEAYTTLLRAYPNDTSGLMALAGLYYTQQRLNEASQIYEDILADDPNNQSAQSALVSLTQGYLYRRGFQPFWERY